MTLPAENLLSAESSPYLRQHADNPVHWRAWSSAALAEAKALDRPILLSVGYAACHWCHVMAHESFEDAETAAVMNRLYVNIKVDREERPDIDQIYMAALTATGEQGGWPLTMFLTPDARPFWGGTYFPNKNQHGRPAFTAVLNAVHAAWTDKKAEIEQNAAALSAHVARSLAPLVEASQDATAPLADLAGSIADMTDPTRGGLRGAPKFPNAPFMNALWYGWLDHGEQRYRDAFLTSLRGMLAGGIYDHVGGGLCRYSTDGDWLVPHFEKMLYDNALMIRHCLWAHADTGDALFRDRIENTIAWLVREMRLDGGAFASSLDADSAGEEGLFYTWTRSRIESVLGGDAGFFFRHYKLGTAQHWEGDPVLFLAAAPQPEDEARRLADLLARLRDARAERIRPGRDDKVLVDWNGLMIRALAEAGRYFDRGDWIDIAADSFRFVVESSERGRLPHSILGADRLFPAMSSDYAAMINAAIALAEASGDRDPLDRARAWARTLEDWYGDGDSAHYLTARDSADVPFRIRGDADDAVPSATSQIVEALIRLAAAIGDVDLTLRAMATARAALGRAAQQRFGQAGIVVAAAMALEPRKLVMTGGAESGFLSVANRYPDPRRVDVMASASSDLGAALPEGTVIDSGAAAYLCLGQTCLPPIKATGQLEARLAETVRRDAP
ncbi:MAG: thioredoxin domain-containing protein [Nitratireductor sp.]